MGGPAVPEPARRHPRDQAHGAAGGEQRARRGGRKSPAHTRRRRERTERVGCCAPDGGGEAEQDHGAVGATQRLQGVLRVSRDRLTGSGDRDEGGQAATAADDERPPPACGEGDRRHREPRKQGGCRDGRLLDPEAEPPSIRRHVLHQQRVGGGLRQRIRKTGEGQQREHVPDRSGHRETQHRQARRRRRDPHAPCRPRPLGQATEACGRQGGQHEVDRHPPSESGAGEREVLTDLHRERADQQQRERRDGDHRQHAEDCPAHFGPALRGLTARRSHQALGPGPALGPRRLDRRHAGAARAADRR